MTRFRRFYRQAQRECLIHLRHPVLLINTSLFLIMVSVFFPLTLPFNPHLLQEVAPGIVWISVVLALLLASERFFQQDQEEGFLELWLASGYSLQILVLAKILVHWLLIILPLWVFCPVLAILFGFSFEFLWLLMLLLLVATPAILCLCALASAFSTGLSQKGMLMALVVLPLAIPVMIFASSALTASLQGFPVSGYLALILAISLLALCFLPWAIASVLRLGLSG